MEELEFYGPEEIEDIRYMGVPYPAEAAFSIRLSEWRPMLGGRGSRMDETRRSRRASDAPPRAGGPLSPFVPFNLAGANAGLNLMRLEFDEKGILIQKEFRTGAPGRPSSR